MKGFSIPFKIKNGKIIYSLDDARVKEKLKALFNIVAGEYFLYPKIGVANWIFSNLTPFMLQTISDQIKRYVPEIEIIDLNYSYDEAGSLVISLKYRLTGEEENFYVYKVI